MVLRKQITKEWYIIKLQYITDCALLMMVYMAGENRIVSSRELEKMIGFPQQSIFSAGRKLKKAGFINTVAGSFGGYTLAKPLEEISIQDILTAFKDEFCMNGEISAEKATTASLRRFLDICHEFEAEAKNGMSAVTLADMLKDKEQP